MLQRYSVRLRIYSWFMKYCHSKLGVCGRHRQVMLVGANTYVSWGHVRSWLGLQVLGKWDSGEKVPHRSTSSPVTSLHELLHRTRMSGSTLNATLLLRRTDRTVTTYRLPQSHREARSYPMDPAYPSTTLVYEVTTLLSPGIPPFVWTSKTLEQARRHNEPLSVPESSSLTKTVA